MAETAEDAKKPKNKGGRPRVYSNEKVRRRANYEKEADIAKQAKTTPIDKLEMGVVETLLVDTDWTHPLFTGKHDITRRELDTWAARDEKYGGPPEWITVYRRSHDGLVNLGKSHTPQDVTEEWIFSKWGPGVYELAAFRNQYDDKRGQMWPRESRRVRVPVCDPETGSCEPRTPQQQQQATAAAAGKNGARPMNEWEFRMQLEERKIQADQAERDRRDRLEREDREERRKADREEREEREKREAKREAEQREFRKEEREARDKADRERRDWEDRQEKLRREYEDRKDRDRVDPLSKVEQIFATVTKVRELAGVAKGKQETHWIERVITNSGDMLDGLGTAVASIWTSYQHFKRSQKVEAAAEAVTKAASNGHANPNLTRAVDEMRKQSEVIDAEVEEEARAREEAEQEEEGDEENENGVTPPPATQQPPAQSSADFQPL